MLFTTKYKRYSHQPLVYWKSQIRLLRVKPDLYGPVRCKIEIFDLDKAPAYAALSYTWGPESPTYDIFIDDRALSVRSNLHCFLKCRRKERNKHFRSEKDLYIFIDQICIDQSDPEERNRQVQLMSQIYSKCWQVIVWLNDEQGQCTRAARAFGQASKRTLALAKLLTNDYFTRLWIVQELLLAPSICVFTPGNTWLEWPTILRITRNAISGTLMTAEESAAWKLVPANTAKLILMTNKFARKRHFIPQRLAPPSKLSWVRFATKSGIRTKSLELLEVLGFSANICHEPRDKVYGLMSLLDVEHRLVVDYNKPIYDVFKDAVIELHSVIDFEDGRSYKQWLKAAQQLGADMGIDSNDIEELFALLEFVNLILPTRSHSAEGDSASLPSLIPMVGVEIIKTPGTQPIREYGSLNHNTIGHEVHRVIEPNIVVGDKGDGGTRESRSSDTPANQYLGLPPGLRQNGNSVANSDNTARKDQAEVTIILEYNIIQEISLYSGQLDDQEPISKEKRWNLLVQSITDVASLRDQGLHLSWYFLHNGKMSKYRTPPNWDLILRISPFRMARIIKEYEEERVNDEESRRQEQRVSENTETACSMQHVAKEQSAQRVPPKKVARVTQYLVYGWLGLVGLLLAIFMVLWCVADMMSHVVPVIVGLWGFYRVAQRRKA